MVVYAPAQGLVTEVLRCEDGPAQERSWCGAVLDTVQAHERWIQDWNVCPWAWRCEIDRRGAAVIDPDLSLSSVAHDIAPTYRGMMMAIPEDAWRVFSQRHPAAMVAPLLEWAQKGRLEASRNSPRGPKQPRPTCEGTTKASQVFTAKLLSNLKVTAVTP